MDNDEYKYVFNGVTLEHYKQMCRFKKDPYNLCDYERYIKQQKYNQYKIWHKRAMDKRDAELALKRKESNN
jgi:hypothetical protein